ncbi:MAG: tol-pal system protein YbgF [Desulfuromonadaceae bacterium]|nr:tol-pal system protein YbgF [Desulfuromonadaceae bacterium]
MHYKIISFIAILAGCLSACVPIQNNENLKTDLTKVQNRMTTLEQRTAGLAQKSPSKEMLHRQAEQRAELDSLRIDMQSINGRLTDQEKAQQQLRQEHILRQNELEARLAELENRLGQLGKELSNKEYSSASVAVPVSTPFASNKITLDTKVSTAETRIQPQSTVHGVSGSGDPEALYREALQLVQQEMNFSAAREKFISFVEKYPEHELAVNAMYWIGETLYGNKKYENAILQFQDVIQMYPQHSKIPAALLKQGLSFYELGDTRNAKIILQKVQDKYPTSPEAQIAQQRLGQW